MRTWTLAVALTVALPSAASAAPCLPATLAEYASLGSAGCTLGGATLFDFSASVLAASDQPIPAPDVQVTPFAAGLGFGLDFGITLDAAPGDVYSVLIGYSLSGVSITTRILSLRGSSVAPDGVALAVGEGCRGGVFVPSPDDVPSSPCAGALMDPALIVFDIGDDAELVAQATFAGESFFDVFAEIVIDGGAFGSASIDGVTDEFRTTTAVPEPFAVVLVGVGLAGLARTRRRAARPPAH